MIINKENKNIFSFLLWILDFKEIASENNFSLKSTTFKDMNCSGIQIIGALLNDSSLLEFTNLLGTEKIDLYNILAESFDKWLEEFLSAGFI